MTSFQMFNINYLKDLLYATGNTVVLVSDDIGVHDTGGGVEGIHGGVDTSLSNRS